jgi:hypothetical protein
VITLSPLPIVHRQTALGFLEHSAPQTFGFQDVTGHKENQVLRELETAKLCAGEPTSGVFSRGAKPGKAAERGTRAISILPPFPTYQRLKGAFCANSSRHLGGIAHG